MTQSDYATIGRRAWNIVDRIMPPTRTPHGYYDTQGFIAACRYGAERNRRYKVIFSRLVEKAGIGADAGVKKIGPDRFQVAA